MIKIIKGFPVDADNRVRTTFTNNPSTLRYSSVNPNLQNIPTGRDSEVQKWVKECFVAKAGSLFWERDFSAIEAVLVGYFAGDPDYIRFAKLGVHAYLASHIAGRPADLKWSDTDLRAYFGALKKSHPGTYADAKRVVHGSNYLMTARKMHYDFPETFHTIKDATRLQGLYFELFPSIPRWHREYCVRVDGTKRRKGEEGEHVDPWTLGVCYVKNPFGYVHRFYNVLDWARKPVEQLADGSIRSEWAWELGEDAKRLIAFNPQSTAAAIIKRAAKRLWVEYRMVVGESLRLLIHDAIFGECAEKDIQTCLDVSQLVMEAPIQQLPLDPAWGLGDFLTIGTEAKVGTSWGGMH